AKSLARGHRAAQFQCLRLDRRLVRAAEQGVAALRLRTVLHRHRYPQRQLPRKVEKGADRPASQFKLDLAKRSAAPAAAQRSAVDCRLDADAGDGFEQTQRAPDFGVEYRPQSFHYLARTQD